MKPDSIVAVRVSDVRAALGIEPDPEPVVEDLEASLGDEIL